MKSPVPSTSLLNGDRVAVVGGGPAGAFFAISLLREARQLDRKIEVVIVEKRRPSDPNFESFQCRGCNYCAGIISPRLNEVLVESDIAIPEEIVQERIEYVWIQGQWKNFRLRVPNHQRMYSVYRGSLPGRRNGRPTGFDGFLLGEAMKEGARLEFGDVQGISYDASGMPVLALKAPSGENVSLDASFVVIATGINPHYGQDQSADALIASMKQLNPSFVPGRTRRSLIFELDVGEDYLERNMNREIYFIEYGSKQLALEHTALIPKGRFLTVAIIGRCVDEANLPQDSRRIIHEFLTLPQVDRILPGIAAAPYACICAPRMTVGTAASPFGDRFAVIGDAVGSRLNKDGLYSAQITASRLAHAVLHEGIDRRALARGYGRTVRWLVDDNRSGHIVFAVSRAAFAMPVMSRIMYQAFALEYKVRDERSRPLSGMLWKIASGTADYGEVLREMLSWGVVRSILVGAAVTLRNVAIEWILGMKWGEYGRFPAVVAMENREAIKEKLAASLAMQLDPPPDFERMYSIKIRGSETEIMEQLAKYGQPDGRFVKLRFVHTQQIHGTPNEVGSVIRYRVPFLQLGAKLHLTKKVRLETLLYEADERLVDHGKVIFDIAPTRDGNRRLCIYAAFDYKKGKSLASRFMWRSARFLFPEFVHDVVWNHALCTLKEDVERGHDRAVWETGSADLLQARL
jgi:flavin-dependent dehydrogenase